jgi:hypothetical protein
MHQRIISVITSKTNLEDAVAITLRNAGFIITIINLKIE